MLVRFRLLALAAACSGAVMLAAAQDSPQDSPLEGPDEKVIQYLRTDDLADPVTLLQKQLSAGKVRLDYSSERGYLPAILKVLKIPASSQALVFSRTSIQGDRIDPANPRAIYFNDEVYVAHVPGSDHLEFASLDPRKGAIFYTLSQSASAEPAFTRAVGCMRCHTGSRTVRTPGFLVRSVLATPDGTAISAFNEFVSGHNSPLSRRWGGWYVTGTSQNDVHAGNSTLADPRHPEAFDPKKGTNVTSLKDRLDTSKYLTPDSDIVSLMVLDDLVRMQDLIIHAGYETRLAIDEGRQLGGTPSQVQATVQGRIAASGELLLSYMLFRDEAPLKGEVKGTTTFAADFQRRGPRDSRGRSLRDFDLKTRLFRYPCSYQIYSRAFDALPPEMKTYLWTRLTDILTGADQSPLYAAMPPEDRRAVFEILHDTKPEFREWCRRHGVGEGR